MSPFKDVSYRQFMESAATFFEATQKRSCFLVSADNGFKTLILLYFGHDDKWTSDEVNESVNIIKAAVKRLTLVEKRNE